MLLNILVEIINVFKEKRMIFKKKNEFGVLSSDRIKEFEAKYNFHLPEAYTNMLLNSNGGFLKKNIFKNNESTEEYYLFVLYGLDTMKSIFNLENKIEIFKERIPKPSIYLPIGDDHGGNLFLLNLINKKIYFWDHNTGYKREKKLEFVAESLNYFLSNLELSISKLDKKPNVIIKDGKFIID
ncbi:SMI1/KNR4 family protein [Flammeovirga yaeyamensis]|nr:SMI1/KNR4 family protein [Flammeovirga yaeyamensis]